MYAAQSEYQKALDDANKATELKPDWAKGWSRKGAAARGLGDLGTLSVYLFPSLVLNFLEETNFVQSLLSMLMSRP